MQNDGKVEFTIQFKAGHERYLSHDDIRVAVTTNHLSVYVAGQENAPMLAGQLRGKIDPERSTWRIRKGKKMKGSTLAIEEIVVELQKEAGENYWREPFKVSAL